jgi:hypothetical protein
VVLKGLYEMLFLEWKFESNTLKCIYPVTYNPSEKFSNRNSSQKHNLIFPKNSETTLTKAKRSLWVCTCICVCLGYGSCMLPLGKDGMVTLVGNGGQRAAWAQGGHCAVCRWETQQDNRNSFQRLDLRPWSRTRKERSTFPDRWGEKAHSSRGDFTYRDCECMRLCPHSKKHLCLCLGLQHLTMNRDS